MKKNKKSKGGIEQFFLWHGEKFVAAILVMVAVWFAFQGLGHPSLSWQPSELEQVADTAKSSIENNDAPVKETAQDFDYSAHATQIRQSLPADAYRYVSPWHPSFGATPSPMNQPPATQE